MDIKGTSQIYRFQDECLFGEAEVPTNLCPYMRRFLKLVGVEFLVGFTLLFLTQAVIMLPVLLWLGVDVEGAKYIKTMYVGGVIVWGATFLMLIAWGAHSLFNREYAARRAMDAAVVKMVAPIKKKIQANIFVQWYKAIHDKICPELNFINKEKM